MREKRLLLISNSTVYGRGYLDHAEDEIRDFLAGIHRVLFVPFALHDREAYAAKVRERFAAMGLELDSLHEAKHLSRAVANAEAMFVGGGNTFRLLNTLYQLDVIPAIRDRVNGGMPYIGSSAGSGIAAPTIRTTNDMPIVQPPSFDALGLIPFQINAHYLDADPTSTHMGETREKRIGEFHEMNEVPVVGLREGSWLRVEGGRIVLGGPHRARIFRRETEPVELDSGSELLF